MSSVTQQPLAKGMKTAPPTGEPVPDPPTNLYTWEQPVVPAGAGSCPQGLEYLTLVDQVLIKQVVELLEVVTGWETNNKYKVLNKMGQQVSVP